MIVFSLIIPYHVNEASKDRLPMMDALLKTIPDRADLEVLWVDDHSTLEWKPTPQIHTQHHQLKTPPTQRYAGLARNFGMEHAKGRWLLFADNDDLFDTQNLNILLDKIAAETTDPIGPYYIGPAESFHQQGGQGNRHTYINTLIERAKSKKDTAWLYYHYTPCAKIIDKKLVDKHNLKFGPWLAGEDAIFSASVADNTPSIVYYEKPFYQIREGHESIMSQTKDDTVIGAFAAHFAVQKLLRDRKHHHLERFPITVIKTYARKKPKLVASILINAIKTKTLLPSRKALLIKLRKRLPFANSINRYRS